ncbi:MAG TPA: cupin domain-containing protein [Candidatus Latescibacteria bacterium]|nr:cupin domain-containing protein [Candidatus Latescibacterota bacterium]
MIKVDESEVEEWQLPGRRMRMLLDRGAGTENLSVCTIWVQPGETVRPAHSHPEAEEVIYIMRGKGRVLVGEEVAPVRPGIAVLFPRGVPHMLQNTGDDVMKVICFFTPPADPGTYRFHEEITFPDEG